MTAASIERSVSVGGSRHFEVIRGVPERRVLADSNRNDDLFPARAWPTDLDRGTAKRLVLPSRHEVAEVNEYRARNLGNVARGYCRTRAARALGVPHAYGVLYGRVIRRSGPSDQVEVVDLGVLSMRLVTTAGATKIVDFLRANDTTTGQNFRYHGFGTGGTAEATGDTTLVTELTTQYASDNTRPTGTQTNNGATVYRTVATLSPDTGGTIAITEHGIFSQAATGGGTLLDRSLFAAVNLVAGSDSLQVTYDFTVNAGG